MKAIDLKPFQTPETLLISTFNTKGISGYSNAYNRSKVGELELNITSCKHTEAVIMGGKTLLTQIGFVRNGKNNFETIRFYDNGNGYEQNNNSVPNGLKF